LSLANKAQYLLINVASVEWLRERIPGNEFEETLETTIQRFRPNLVVKFDNAYVENYCEKFIFEDVSFEVCCVNYWILFNFVIFRLVASVQDAK
jgi:uncharacterized protein YcbX